MAGSPEGSSGEGKRAKRVALRTLQRRPNFIGENDLGEPIVEVASVRLVLPHGAQYLHHLGTCTRCAKDALGDAVMNTGDLQPRVSNMFCADCARVSGMEARVEPEVVEENEELASPTGPEETTTDPPVVSGPIDVSEAGLEDHARLLASELGAVLADRFDQGLNQLGTVLAKRFDHGLNQLGAALATRMDTGLQELAAASMDRAAPAGTDLQELGTALAARFDRRLNELGTALASRFDQSLRELVVPAGPLEDGVELAALAGRLEEDRAGLASLAGRLEEDRAEFAALARRLEEDRAEFAALARRLEEDRAGLASRVETVVRDGLAEQRREMASELEGAFVGRFERSLQELATIAGQSKGGAGLTALAGSLEGSFGELRTALESRLEEGFADLAGAIASRLRDDQGKLVSRLEAALHAGLDEQRRGLGPEMGTTLSGPLEAGFAEVRAALGTRLEEGFAELAGAIAGRLRDDQNKLVARVEVAVRSGLEEERQALASELERTLSEGLAEQRETFDSEMGVLMAGRFEQGLRELGSRLDERSRRDHDQLVSQLAEVLRAGREHDRLALVTERTTALDDVDSRIRTARDELYDRLERVAEGATEAGTIAARAMIRSTEEYASATAVSLAGHISDLQRDMATAQQRLTEVLEAVERLDRRVVPSDVEKRAPVKRVPLKRAAKKAPARTGVRPAGKKRA